MLIECSFCHAKAKIPDSKEGAKVKCGECGKIYVARDPSSKGAKKTNPAPFIIGGAAVVGIIVVFFIVNSRDKSPITPVAAKTPVVEEKPIDRVGYESELVRVVRDVYSAAFAGNTMKLQSQLHMPKIVERLKATPERASLADFAAMSALEKDDIAKEAIEQFLHGEGDAHIAAWEPHDGRVEAEGDTEATIRLMVHGREGDLKAENRIMEWKIAKDERDQGKWKVWSWERWVSPEEKKAQASARTKGITKVTFEDGGMLYQAEPKPIPHYEDTPETQRKEIDALVEKLIDFKLKPRENDAAGRDLVAIGKPAVPALLTKLYDFYASKALDDETLGKTGKVYFTFRDITGYDPGFAVTANDPDSQAKRDACIKACFAWFQRKGDRFTEKKEGVDLLEGMVQPTERDRREMEKAAQKKGGG